VDSRAIGDKLRGNDPAPNYGRSLFCAGQGEKGEYLVFFP
jgi:hypothetical protein